MTSKFIPNVISLITSFLIAYGFFAFYIGENNEVRFVTTIVVFVFSLLILIPTFGISFESDRITTVIGFVGTTFYFIGLVLLILVMIFTESIPWLILPMGLLSVLYFSVLYFVSKSGQ